MGAYIVWFPHARVLSLVPILFFFGFIELPAIAVLGIWFVMQFFTNPNDGIAWLAHVGGFAAGAAVAFALRSVLPPAPLGPPRPPPVRGRRFSSAMATTGTTTGTADSAAAIEAACSDRASRVHVRVDEVGHELCEVGRDELGCGLGHGFFARAARNAGEHEREGPLQGVGERSVGGRPVADDDPTGAVPLADERDHRGSGLPATSGSCAGGGRDRGDERARAGHAALPRPDMSDRCSSRRNAPRSGSRRTRAGQTVEIELAVPADDDRIGGTAIDEREASCLHRLDDTSTGTRQDA